MPRCSAPAEACGQGAHHVPRDPERDHFNALEPGCDVIAKAILADTGDKPAIRITVGAIQAAMRGHQAQSQGLRPAAPRRAVDLT
jgi:hypothetical protein